MTIPASSAPAARTWLFNALTAQLTPDSVNMSSSLLVCYDGPGPNEPDDIVAVGKITRHVEVSSFVGGGGAGWLNESYTIELTIDVYRGGDVDQAAYLRCSSLVDAAIAVVRSDLTLGGAVVTARPITDVTEVAWDESHMGRHATSTVEIQCVQRI
jgi:hypothetical protein